MSDGGVDQPLLDLEIVESLAQLGQRRGRDLLGQLVGMFAEQGPRSFATLRQALADGDAAAVRETAHSLKGSYRSLGTVRLATLCAELEDRARNSQLAGQSRLLEQLEVDFESTHEALEAYLQEKARSLEST